MAEIHLHADDRPADGSMICEIYNGSGELKYKSIAPLRIQTHNHYTIIKFPKPVTVHNNDIVSFKSTAIIS